MSNAARAEYRSRTRQPVTSLISKPSFAMLAMIIGAVVG
jgi:hypothetical protein